MPEYKATSDEKVFKASEPKRYVVTFKYNRSTDLHIGNSVYMFAPNGTLSMDESVINSPDFKQRKNDFVISEVK